MPDNAPAVDYAVSVDGTRIGFERIGYGPGLVLVQGAMGNAYSFRELAEALADAFTVIVPDRRGRGLSPHPYAPDYTVIDDVHDLDAVLGATDSRYVFGLSSGGDVVLRATAALPQIEKIALYEPAIFPDGVPSKGVSRFKHYATAGDLAGMLTTGMKVAEMGPPFMRAMPDWAVKLAIRGIMRAEAKFGSGNYAPMAELAVAFQFDFAIVRSMDGSIETFRSITQPVLLLGGSKSPSYLRRTLGALERVIPNVHRVQLEGVDHAAAWNPDPRRNANGNPKAVADQLRNFFSAG